MSEQNIQNIQNNNVNPDNQVLDESHDAHIDMDIDNDTFIQDVKNGNLNSLIKKNNQSGENKIDETKIGENKTGENKIEESITYKIPRYKKMEHLNKELEEVSDKSTIYEYHFEKLNKIYDGIGFVNLIIDLCVILVGSISLLEILNFETEILVIVLAFINGIFTGINKIFKYKDKITHIGKYMSDMEHLKNDIKIMLLKIEYENICDRDYFRQLQKIDLILTNSNSSIFNIDSDEYYDYYTRMKRIKEKKRRINHDIYLEKERKYNDFSKKHLDYISNRLTIQKKIKDIQKQATTNNITDFSESDLFTITNLTTNEE